MLHWGKTMINSPINTPPTSPEPTPPASPQPRRPNRNYWGVDGLVLPPAQEAVAPSRGSPFQAAGAVAMNRQPSETALATSAPQPSASAPLHRNEDYNARRQRINAELNDYLLRATPQQRMAREDLLYNLRQLPELNPNSYTQMTYVAVSSGALGELPQCICEFTSMVGLTIIDAELTRLPDNIGNLNQLRSLYVIHNQLQTLPDSIGNCSSLIQIKADHNPITHLPDVFERLNDLKNLSICNTRLTTFPESVGQPGRAIDIYASNNPLTSLPRSLTLLPWTSTLQFSLNAMSDDVRQQVLNMFDYSGAGTDRTIGPRLDYDMGTTLLQTEYLPAGQVMDQWFRDAAEQDLDTTAPPGIRDMALTTGFTKLLNFLRQSPFYANKHTRTVLAERVTNLLQHMSESSALRARLENYVQSENLTTTCIDGVSVGFNTMEMMARHHQLENSDAKDLSEIAAHLIGAHRAILVEQAAGEEILAQRAVRAIDDVEVLMYIQTALREPLNLPFNMTAGEGMFLGLARVTQETLDTIKENVLALSGTLEQQAEILAQDSAWKTCVERRLQAEGTSVKDQIERHFSALETRYENRPYDETYDREINGIGSRPYVKAALEALGRDPVDAPQPVPQQDADSKEENRSSRGRRQPRGDAIPARLHRDRSPSPPPGTGTSTGAGPASLGGRGTNTTTDSSSPQTGSNQQRDVRPKTRSAAGNATSANGPTIQSSKRPQAPDKAGEDGLAPDLLETVLEAAVQKFDTTDFRSGGPAFTLPPTLATIPTGPSADLMQAHHAAALGYAQSTRSAAYATPAAFEGMSSAGAYARTAPATADRPVFAEPRPPAPPSTQTAPRSQVFQRAPAPQPPAQPPGAPDLAQAHANSVALKRSQYR